MVGCMVAAQVPSISIQHTYRCLHPCNFEHIHKFKWLSMGVSAHHDDSGSRLVVLERRPAGLHDPWYVFLNRLQLPDLLDVGSPPIVNGQRRGSKRQYAFMAPDDEMMKRTGAS